jgi:hypothetical protein
MQQLPFPKDVLDIIFNYCNIHDKVSIKMLCEYTNESYIITYDNPYINYPIKCTIMYNKKKEYTFILKNNNFKTEQKKIMKAYNYLIETYKLDKNESMTFTIKWNNKNIKYTIKNDKIISKNKYDNYTEPIRRKFCIIFNNKRFGTYMVRNPKQAAAKAFSSLIRKKKIDLDIFGHCTTDFVIQEMTYGSSHKYYYYKGESTKLKNPRIVHIGNIPVTYSRNNIITQITPNYELLDYKIVITNN